MKDSFVKIGKSPGNGLVYEKSKSRLIVYYNSFRYWPDKNKQFNYDRPRAYVKTGRSDRISEPLTKLLNERKIE